MPLDEYMLERMLGFEWQERLPPICPECGYNLTGLPDNRCPECGYVYSRRDVKRNAQMMINVIRQFRSINEIVTIGLCVGIASTAVLLGLWACRYGPLVTMGRILAAFAALPTIGLGLQVFRVKRLPRWAQEFVPLHPSYGKGAIATILGVALLVAALLLP
jgi:hypothetical protein